jgi:hypothetical protein
MRFKLLLILSATLILVLGVACGGDSVAAPSGADLEVADEANPTAESEVASVAATSVNETCFPSQMEDRSRVVRSLVEVVDINGDEVTINVTHLEQRLEGLALPKDQVTASMGWSIGEFHYGLEYLPIVVGTKGYETLPICSADPPELDLFVNTELYCGEAGSPWVEVIRQRIRGALWVPDPCAPVEIPTVSPH